ncbi:hypothetical protein IscW_ISCW017509 [Ixodes scapularis]|uniref:Uncharacterized protein n=1 Tax=Ixodes scapularis TaxID=6945 RepID=B7PB08_IXOSC|nr:hypothetical protein IscW_ISCW017509 [Ixodes scapularis]|eukprot:XP_002407619.1 hypothetical protein IscW_ISCW017509 [Ixodes scapularis]
MAVLLLQTFQATTPTTRPEECPLWKGIVNSRGFRNLLLGASSSAYLDIMLPPEFGVEEIRPLTQLPKVLPTSQNIISKSRDFCNLFTCPVVES